jgi:transposase
MATKKVSDSMPRKWEDVMPQIQKLVTNGMSYQHAADALDVSYVLVNQLAVQSYKSSIHTEELFDVQEKKRLGLMD